MTREANVPRREVLTLGPEKSLHDLSFPPDAEGSDAAEVDRREHAANIERTERALGLGATLIALLGLVDVFTVHMHKYPALAGVWVPRGLLIALGLAIRARLRRRPPVTPDWLRAADLVAFGWASVTVTLLAMQSGGFASPDVYGLVLILLAQVLTVPCACTKTALRLGLTIAIFAVTMAIAAALSPSMASQLGDSAVMLAFGEHMAGVLAAAALLVAAGHSHWQARRRVMATRTVGRYVLGRQIGHGGMGEVWRAYHPALRRDVAIKIMRPDRVTPAMNARFEREISTLTDLSHPNTVRVFDCGTTGEGLLYCVMELCTGRTLRELVLQEGPLPPARAVHIVRQVARALAEAHARRIVHRDIKPDNIVVTSAGGERDFVKVLDFGIAKLEMDHGDAPELTEEHLLIGTPAYMSPEQSLAGAVDARSDLYALGAVLFFALTGRPPFQGSIPEVLRSHRNDPAPPVAAFAPDVVHPRLQTVIHRCLAKDPRRRFASALELDAALAAVPSEETANGPRLRSVRPPREATSPPSPRGPREEPSSRIRSVPSDTTKVPRPHAAADPAATVRLSRNRTPGS